MDIAAEIDRITKESCMSVALVRLQFEAGLMLEWEAHHQVEVIMMEGVRKIRSLAHVTEGSSLVMIMQAIDRHMKKSSNDNGE